jgi:putative membrane protein insertion efficiency factor
MKASDSCKIQVLLSACFFALICIVAPWSHAEPGLPQQIDHDKTHFAAWPIRMYQTYVSSMGGHRCPMKPSCSQYSIEAFKKHGYLLGWIMTSDRLLRCGRDETRLSRTLRKNNEIFSYDPLENNDFWWSHEQQ